MTQKIDLNHIKSEISKRQRFYRDDELILSLITAIESMREALEKIKYTNTVCEIEDRGIWNYQGMASEALAKFHERFE